MSQKNTTNNLFKSGRPFYYRGIFSGSVNKKTGSTLNSYSSALIEEKNSPSLSNIPKRNLDQILHYLLMQELKKAKQRIDSPYLYNRSRNFLFQYHKDFQLIGRLKGRALCLLQTKYALKPKNPE